MDYTGLKTELAKSDYTGKTQSEILTRLNTPASVTVARGLVDGKQFYGDLVSLNLTIAVRALPDNTPVPNGVPVTPAQLKEILDDMRYVAVVNCAAQSVQNLLGVLVAYGLATSQQYQDLITSMVTQSIGQGLGFETVTADDLLTAGRQ